MRTDDSVSQTPVMARTIVYIILGTMLLPGMDAIAKGLKGHASVATITCVRNVVQVGLLLPLVIYQYGISSFRVVDWHFHFVRSFCIVFCGITFFASVQLMPLADALAISFVSPMIVAALSPVVLQEHLTRWQWAAVVMGFAGALIIIRPGGHAFGLTAFLPLISALFYAGYGLATRKLTIGSTPTLLLQFWSGLFSTLLIVPVMLIGNAFAVPPLMFVVPENKILLLLLAMGVFGTCGHLLITFGARHVSALLTAGLGYSEIISASILGWYFFHNFPDFWTWTGVIIIVASGLWLTRLASKTL